MAVTIDSASSIRLSRRETGRPAIATSRLSCFTAGKRSGEWQIGKSRVAGLAAETGGDGKRLRRARVESVAEGGRNAGGRRPHVEVIDARFCKHLDGECSRVLRPRPSGLTVETTACKNGFGTAVLEHASKRKSAGRSDHRLAGRC